MPRIRTLKPELWRSDDFQSLDCHGQLAFIWLISNADDEGRLKTNPAHIARELHVESVGAAITQMVARGMLVVYAAHMAVVNFPTHQVINRPTPSRYPPPPLTEDSVSPLGVVSEDSLQERNGEDRNGEDRKGVGEERGRAREVSAVFSAYKANTNHPNRVLSPDSRQVIIQALMQFGLERCIRATRGWVHDPWPERVTHLEPKDVFKASNVERFAEWDEAGPPRQLSKTDRQNLEVEAWAREAERVGEDRRQDQQHLQPGTG